MGLGENSSVLHIVDMGLAKKYKDHVTGEHLKFRNGKSLTGTARYTSVHSHLGEELSRRDDFEAIGYVLLYFLTGQLPWQNLGPCTRKESYKKIKDKKMSIHMSELCFGCPPEFEKYMNYCKDLKFEEDPDYDYLK
jgi:serine/threonine protein kinase